MSNLVYLLDAQKVKFFSGIFRQFFAFLCEQLFKLVSGLLETIFYLANFDILDLADEMMNRVYIIIGLFMLFKITISLLNYLVNPDKINDKEAGASKMMARVVISLSMLILLPGAFSIMTDLQNQLLPVLPRIIIGKDTANSGSKSTDIAKATADNMVITIVQGFVYPADGCTEIPINTLDDFSDNIVEKCYPYDQYYALSFHSVIALIVAVLMVYVTFSLAIATAIRAFKLIILRVIAPAPVLSYIDPKSSKGDGMFSKWTKLFLSTWAELLVNLGIIYFIIFMIQKLFTNNNWKTYLSGAPGEGFVHGLVIAFLIIGLLMFAREAPKFIMDALGIKNSGGFTRMLGMGTTALGGIGATVSTAGAVGKRAAANFGTGHWVRGIGNLVSGAGATLTAGGRSLSAGGHALLTDKDGNIGAGTAAQRKWNAQNLTNLRTGNGVGSRLLTSSAFTFLGNDIEYELNQANARAASAKKLREFSIAEGTKTHSNDDTYAYTGLHISKNQLMAEVNLARANGRAVDLSSYGGSSSMSESAINKMLGDADDFVAQAHIDDFNRGVLAPDKAAPMDSFYSAYSDAMGVSKAAGKSHNALTIKANQKKNETKAFKLEQQRGPKK